MLEPDVISSWYGLLQVPPQRSGPSAYDKASCPFGRTLIFFPGVLTSGLRGGASHLNTLLFK